MEPEVSNRLRFCFTQESGTQALSDEERGNSDW